MPPIILKCANLPGSELSFTNAAYVNPNSYEQLKQGVRVSGKLRCDVKGLILNVEPDSRAAEGDIGLNKMHRQCAKMQTGTQVTVTPYAPTEPDPPIGTGVLEVALFTKEKPLRITDEELERQFKKQFMSQVFTKHQLAALKLEAEGIGMQFYLQKLTATPGGTELVRGVVTEASEMQFVNQRDGGVLTIISKKTPHRQLFKHNFNFEELGIGGLDKEFSDIFRRAFASRIYPPHILADLGINHVRGMLLYGPPGTGKTLIARQIGKALHAKEPKIVNGPEILNKFVGQSEENIRNLFKDAEDEQKKKGENSQLHIIIFDELDAVCKSRGSNPTGAGVNDSVVNQLLSKIDGVDSLNNILLIGMTNRLDMIDDALLRPGRLEVHVEISLPDEDGRVQIINIHTRKMRQSNRLSPDVSISALAKQTKNFSGAEIEGLVRTATSWAFNRSINVKDLATPMDSDNITVSNEDFERALEEVKPLFGAQDDQFEALLRNGIIEWGQEFSRVQANLTTLARQVQESAKTPVLSILLHGATGTGKTALAAHIARTVKFPFMKLVSPGDCVGYSEHAKCSLINRTFEDAYKSELSIIVLDSIERLIDFSRMGPRYSNSVLQALMVLAGKSPPKAERSLCVIATTSEYQFMQDCGLAAAFHVNLEVPMLTKDIHISKVLNDRSAERGDIEPDEIDLIRQSLKDPIGIKRLQMVTEMAAEYCKPGPIKSETFMQCLEDCGFEAGH
eukprot:GHVU01016485.1.p1 GENE.GHVU01016485.1~~GHVU01016485.1.p1  ORF type:complete len:735 (-),score=154.54 GHVU01016485.1:537-2741(-)